jgi:hypothetical protein
VVVVPPVGALVSNGWLVRLVPGLGGGGVLGLEVVVVPVPVVVTGLDGVEVTVVPVPVVVVTGVEPPPVRLAKLTRSSSASQTKAVLRVRRDVIVSEFVQVKLRPNRPDFARRMGSGPRLLDRVGKSI